MRTFEMITSCFFLSNTADDWVVCCCFTWILFSERFAAVMWQHECRFSAGSMGTGRRHLKHLLICILGTAAVFLIYLSFDGNWSPGSLSRYHVAYPRNYQIIMDDTPTCRTRSPFLVMMVPVAPSDVAARDADKTHLHLHPGSGDHRLGQYELRQEIVSREFSNQDQLCCF